MLIRSNGERRETSVQRHTEFIKSRTKHSNELVGRVAFNEMVRLLKWWREVQCEGYVDTYPSILIDQLAAHAFRSQSVDETYAATLARWFGFLAHEVGRRAPVYFDDFVRWPSPPQAAGWSVMDPVSSTNNVAGNLGNIEVDALAEWLASARDHVLQAIAADRDDDETAAMNALIPVFGRHVIHNSWGQS